MDNYNFNYSFSITGNCNAVVQDIFENVGGRLFYACPYNIKSVKPFCK